MGAQRTIYMDHSATTFVKPEVVNEMIPYFMEHFGNPSSIYGIARESKKAIDTARVQTAKALGA
ncbi:MAG: aminotransferase class V-fold PLP-dependent enzyme, partial [Methanoregula sp.]|nr:aminotransferase class V-fold PLP-dependent enzyme [Methanoregula sp.]